MPRPTHYPDSMGKIHVASIYYDAAVDGYGVDSNGNPDPGNYILLPGRIPNQAMVILARVQLLEEITGSGELNFSLYDGDDSYSLLADTITESTAVGTLDPNGNFDFDTDNHGKVFPLPDDEADQLARRSPRDIRVRALVESATITAGKVVIHIIYVMSPNLEVE